MNLYTGDYLDSLTKEQLILLIKREKEEHQDILDADTGSEIICWVYDIETERLIFRQGSTRLFGGKKGQVLSFDDIIKRIHPEDKVLISNFTQEI